jgi:hypothetical protein
LRCHDGGVAVPILPEIHANEVQHNRATAKQGSLIRKTVQQVGRNGFG